MIGAECGARHAMASGLAQSGVRLKPELTSIRALVFDTFGTVVDWRTSVTQEVEQLAKRKGLRVNAEKFADAWRAGYGPSMNRVRTGELPWTKLDGLHRMILDKLLIDFGIAGLSQAETDALNHAWHRLRPWPDTVAGLMRLKKRFIIAPLSNGNISLMVDLARRNNFPWDAILGAETAGDYKPKPRVYLAACEAFDLPPADCMMVAAHTNDLLAAAKCGLRTAHIARPNERGPGTGEAAPKAPVDFAAKSLEDLATQLGA
jgi:2-haloacid dehalogenase